MWRGDGGGKKGEHALTTPLSWALALPSGSISPGPRLSVLSLGLRTQVLGGYPQRQGHSFF